MEVKKRHKGQWQPGQTGNPKGRPPSHNSVRQLLDKRSDEIWEAIIDKAVIDKDPAAMRIVAERCEPPRRRSQLVVLPEVQQMLDEGADYDAITRALLRSVSAGQIDADDADQMLGMIESARKRAPVTALDVIDSWSGVSELADAIESMDETGSAKVLEVLKRIRAENKEVSK